MSPNPPSLEAADELVSARRTGARLDDLRDRPASLSEAYAVQDEAARRWGDAVAGWKVGATSQEVQRLFGIDEPVYGPVFRRDVHASPARLSARAFQHTMLEAEYAFRFGRTLPSRPQAYSRDEIVEAVDAVIPALEIISPRYAALRTDDIPQLVADFGANGGAVLGSPREDWRGLDLAGHAVRLVIAGAERQSGTGAVVLGHPLNVLDWLANTLSRRGRAIEAGQIVLTGTMTGIHSPGPGQVAVADFGELGQVEVRFD